MLNYRRVAVPRDLASITQIDHAAETPPNELGVSDRGLARIWEAVENLYRTGLQPAFTIVIRRHGRILMKRSIGNLHGTGPGERDDRVVLSSARAGPAPGSAGTAAPHGMDPARNPPARRWAH